MNAAKKTTPATFFFFFCLLWSVAVWLVSWFYRPLALYIPWAEALVRVLALAATLSAYGRLLPAQNIVFAAVLIAIISGAAETIGAKTGVPFGPFVYTDHLGPQLFGVLPWAIPFIWIVAVLNSRGTARLILRPWRSTPNYGFWAIGLTCLLTVLFDANLEPFAARVSRFWIWQTASTVPAWYGAPWINFAGWGVVTLLLLGLITPWLINKKPESEPPSNCWPVLIWMSLSLAMITISASARLWGAVAFGLITSLLVGVAARINSR